MQTPADACAVVTRHLNGYVERSGKVFYSSLSSLLRGDVMFIGYNPGGQPGDSEAEKIRVSMMDLTWDKENDFVAQYWKDSANQKHNVLQRRVQALFEEIGVNLHDVFTTNLYFQRTRGIEDGIAGEVKIACWNALRELLAHSPSRLWICNGVTTFKELVWHASPHAGVERISLTHKKWSVMRTSFDFAGRNVTVIGVPHLSWYSPARDPALVATLRNLARKS